MNVFMILFIIISGLMFGYIISFYAGLILKRKLIYKDINKVVQDQKKVFISIFNVKYIESIDIKVKYKMFSTKNKTNIIINICNNSELVMDKLSDNKYDLFIGTLNALFVFKSFKTYEHKIIENFLEGDENNDN